MKPWHLMLGAFVVLTFFALGAWDQIVNRDDVRFVEEANAALATGNAYRSRIATLTKAQRTHTVVMTRWRTIADTASTDSGRAFAWRNAAESCERALLACSERALLAEARVAEIEPFLARGIKLVDCRILGLRFAPRCMSRTASFFVGAGLGSLGTLLIQ